MPKTKTQIFIKSKIKTNPLMFLTQPIFTHKNRDKNHNIITKILCPLVDDYYTTIL